MVFGYKNLGDLLLDVGMNVATLGNVSYTNRRSFLEYVGESFYEMTHGKRNRKNFQKKMDDIAKKFESDLYKIQN